MTIRLILSPKSQVVFERQSEDDVRKDQKPELETRNPQKTERLQRTKKPAHRTRSAKWYLSMPPRSS
ncbi:uncharacterized protein H6S33_012462 [Morchella sextelata]|uniref:uncharacterized protein n=1 Tax=Morchella sextelata TaxID=1174677 RepID=UPI001D04A549|nr:uncharacterized protein H6S33_012462 [Morchella sextelata]KAH0609916.1 hypothetical protein H6S33_012462 [Morchella sextelata]